MTRLQWLCVAWLFVGCGNSTTQPLPDAGHVVDCRPRGRWNLGYQAVDAGMGCAPTSDVLVLSDELDGGVRAELESFAPKEVRCSPATTDAGFAAAGYVVSFDEGDCSLQLTARQVWCFSGEQQCQHRTLSLHFDGDEVTGDATSGLCWCVSASRSHETLRATGQRAP